MLFPTLFFMASLNCLLILECYMRNPPLRLVAILHPSFIRCNENAPTLLVAGGFQYDFSGLQAAFCLHFQRKIFQN
jgi:hypothetical protein